MGFIRSYADLLAAYRHLELLEQLYSLLERDICLQEQPLLALCNGDVMFSGSY